MCIGSVHCTAACGQFICVAVQLVQAKYVCCTCVRKSCLTVPKLCIQDLRGWGRCLKAILFAHVMCRPSSEDPHWRERKYYYLYKL